MAYAAYSTSKCKSLFNHVISFWAAVAHKINPGLRPGSAKTPACDPSHNWGMTWGYGRTSRTWAVGCQKKKNLSLSCLSTQGHELKLLLLLPATCCPGYQRDITGTSPVWSSQSVCCASCVKDFALWSDWGPSPFSMCWALTSPGHSQTNSNSNMTCCILKWGVTKTIQVRVRVKIKVLVQNHSRSKKVN